jgi:hypothetical protein
MSVLNENPVTREEMKINALATKGEPLQALSFQSVVVERVIFVVFTLLAALILVDASLANLEPKLDSSPWAQIEGPKARIFTDQVWELIRIWFPIRALPASAIVPT